MIADPLDAFSLTAYIISSFFPVVWVSGLAGIIFLGETAQ
jgi:hypothetical protein